MSASEPTREQLRLCVHELGHACAALALGYEVCGFSVRQTTMLGSGWVLSRVPTPHTIEEARRVMSLDAAGAVAEFLGGYSETIIVRGFDLEAVDELIQKWFGRTAPPEVHKSELLAAIDTAKRLLQRGATMARVEKLARRLAEFQTEFDSTFTLMAGLDAAAEPVRPDAAGSIGAPLAQAASPPAAES